MTDTRTFHIGDLLSAYTGAPVSPDGIDGFAEILNHLTGDILMSHQFPLAMDAMHPELLLQHPWLKSINAPIPAGKAERVTWVASMADIHGEHHEIQPAPHAWGRHDPIADLRNQWPDARVIGVAGPDSPHAP